MGSRGSPRGASVRSADAATAGSAGGFEAESTSWVGFIGGCPRSMSFERRASETYASKTTP